MIARCRARPSRKSAHLWTAAESDTHAVLLSMARRSHSVWMSLGVVCLAVFREHTERCRMRGAPTLPDTAAVQRLVWRLCQRGLIRRREREGVVQYTVTVEGRRRAACGTRRHTSAVSSSRSPTTNRRAKSRAQEPSP